MELFYDDANVMMRVRVKLASGFASRLGKNRCNMSGFMFLFVMDWILRRTVGREENGIRWEYDGLEFADDIALFSSTKQSI